jgi:hypothetical protein
MDFRRLLPEIRFRSPVCPRVPGQGVPHSEARHADTDAFAQEVSALFGRQGEQAADQIALG